MNHLTKMMYKKIQPDFQKIIQFEILKLNLFHNFKIEFLDLKIKIEV